MSAAADLRTILFTDMNSFTAVTQKLGDLVAQDLVRIHNEIVREALRLYHGTEIKHTGDGIMAAFVSASKAIKCDVRIQQMLVSYNDNTDKEIIVRIGINAGEPIVEENDLFGTSVQLAARLCKNAGGGEILVSDVVRQLVAGKKIRFVDRGNMLFHGFDEPTRVYEIQWYDGKTQSTKQHNS